MQLQSTYNQDADILAIRDSNSVLSLSSKAFYSDCVQTDIDISSKLKISAIFYKPTGELLLLLLSGYSFLKDNITNNDLIAYFVEAQNRIKELFYKGKK